MTIIVKPLRWWDMVTPREEEMPGFLRAYMGKGKQFRTPKRIWQDLWMRKRGEMNHVMGMRKFGTIKNFTGPKYQRGIICATAFGVAPAGGGTDPSLLDISNHWHQTAPVQARQFYGYDSDGSMEWEETSTFANIVWGTELTTGTDDSNDHTNKWWPDQPETNEGLNWDIRYLNEVLNGRGGTSGGMHLFKNAAVNRNSGQWYLLDTVSNDRVNGTQDGAIGHNRGNGTTKNPDSGHSNADVDVEIRVKDTGIAVASHSYVLDTGGS